MEEENGALRRRTSCHKVPSGEQSFNLALKLFTAYDYKLPSETDGYSLDGLEQMMICHQDRESLSRLNNRAVTVLMVIAKKKHRRKKRRAKKTV